MSDAEGYEAGGAVAERLAAGAVAALGPRVAGVVLHGSLAFGDYVADKSDIDVLVIVDGVLDDDDKEVLAARVVALGRETQSRLDFRVVTAATARRPDNPPLLELEVAVRPGTSPDSSVVGGPRAEPDLVNELSICRSHGRALVGPAPAALIGEIPTECLHMVGDAQLASWLSLPFEQQYAELMVFTACRIWRLAEGGGHAGKHAAAAWVLRLHPELRIVADALRRRAQQSPLELDEERVRELLRVVRRRVAQAQA